MKPAPEQVSGRLSASRMKEGLTLRTRRQPVRGSALAGGARPAGVAQVGVMVSGAMTARSASPRIRPRSRRRPSSACRPHGGALRGWAAPLAVAGRNHPRHDLRRCRPPRHAGHGHVAGPAEPRQHPLRILAPLHGDDYSDDLRQGVRAEDYAAPPAPADQAPPPATAEELLAAAATLTNPPDMAPLSQLLGRLVTLRSSHCPSARSWSAIKSATRHRCLHPGEAARRVAAPLQRHRRFEPGADPAALGCSAAPRTQRHAGAERGECDHRAVARCGVRRRAGVEHPWDGLCLVDMLELPEKIRPLVSDYKMNLSELRISGTLQFHNQDVNTVFDISRAIYECDYDKINTVYGRMQITSELGVVIGAITQSQKLIDHALKLEQNGVRLICVVHWKS